MPTNQRYYARLCWNSEQWTGPTGEASELEFHTSFVASSGFGYEEWLFNFRLIDGFQYGFLQPVERSWRRYIGKKIDLLLWSISSGGVRVWVGSIENCEIIDEPHSTRATNIYRERGWLDDMRADVAKISGADIQKLSGDALFNIRFKRNDATLFPSPYSTVEPDALVNRVKRYQLNPVPDSASEQKIWSTSRTDSFDPQKTEPIYRRGQAGRYVERDHAKLQTELLSLLKGSLKGSGFAVTRESGFVDLTVQDRSRAILIEIKSTPVPREAIREAFGQIMEYAFWRQNYGKRLLSLFIVAPGHADAATSSYLALLRERFGIPITYCAFAVGSPLPSELARCHLA